MYGKFATYAGEECEGEKVEGVENSELNIEVGYDIDKM